MEKASSSLSPERVEFTEVDEEVRAELSSDIEKTEGSIEDPTGHPARREEFTEPLASPEEAPAPIEGPNGSRSRLRALQAKERGLERELTAAMASDRLDEAARVRRAYNENDRELMALCRALGLIR